MSQINAFIDNLTRNGYRVKLAAALAASTAGGAFWASQNLPAGHADRWQDVAILFAAIAIYLVWKASEKTPEQKAEARRQKERRVAILRARAAAAGPSRDEPVDDRRPSIGAGAPTGFLNTVHATIALVREIVPSFKSSLKDLLNPDADAATRIGGAITLGLKSAAVVAFGWIVYLEGLQLRGAAYKAWADACIARQQAEINYGTLSDLLSGSTSNLDADCKRQ